MSEVGGRISEVRCEIALAHAAILGTVAAAVPAALFSSQATRLPLQTE